MNLRKTLQLILFVLFIFSCEKEEVTILDNPSLSESEITGSVILPEGSTIDLSDLTISSPIDQVRIENDSYRMENIEDRFLTQLVGNENGDIYLMGYTYPGQTDFEINSKSTALAMLMNMAPSLLMTPEGKQELIEQILISPRLVNIVSEIETSLLANESPLSLQQTKIAELVATYYDEVFTLSSKLNKKQDDESYPVEILRTGNELTFINPGKSYETIVGIYKDNQLEKTLNVGRVNFFPTSILEVLGAVVDANLGQVPSGLQPLEETFTMNSDGKYDIHIRNGFYTNGIDTENVQAYVINLINWDTDILLEFLPSGDCVVPTIKALKSFISNSATLVGTQNPSSGEILSLLLDLLITSLEQSPLVSGCFAAENITFPTKLVKLLKFTDLVGKLGKVSNVLVGIAQWVYDDGALDKCYEVEGNQVTECDDKDVYVVGYEHNSITDIPKMWKNGTATSLSDGSNNDRANAVYVSGNDVYVVGQVVGGNNIALANVWKNGIATPLTSGSVASANSVYVSENDVYVVGNENSKARIWKNGVATSLADVTSYAYSVYVSGSDVYVAGSKDTNNFVATIWKNGVATSLTDGSNRSIASSVYISGNDVYVAGYIAVRQASGQYINTAKVWKNGVATSLTDGVTSNSIARSIYVSGTDVYVAGDECEFGSNCVAKIWKNGVGTSLSSADAYDAHANSVYVSGDDIYVTGIEAFPGTSNMATVWKNGVVTYLTDGSNNARPVSIFVK